MAELLHIDDDWKKQAQEEKRRLAEEQQKRQAAPPAAPPALVAPVGSGRQTQPSKARRAPREMPPASFASLVQSVLTQALYHLGELAPAGAEGTVNLDMAKHHIDTLGVLEQKTVNNLDETEKHVLDAALYEARARFVSLASQFI
jgi:hypothetical protein